MKGGWNRLFDILEGENWRTVWEALRLLYNPGSADNEAEWWSIGEAFSKISFELFDSIENIALETCSKRIFLLLRTP